MGSFYTFMGSALYLFLKRFYLNEIIAFVFGLVITLTRWSVLPTLLLIEKVMNVDFMNYYGDVDIVRIV